jgi:hypothetical protein
VIPVGKRDARATLTAVAVSSNVKSEVHTLTQAPTTLNGSFEPLPTGAELVVYWRARLREGERKTLDVLLASPGDDVARETIDHQTGYKWSSRDAYLTRLKARGLVEFSGRGTVRSSKELS